MWFWWFMLFSNLLIPLLLIVVGLIMYKFPKKRINRLIGYRTSTSMENQKQWDFAQKYSSKAMLFSGIFMLIPSILFTIPTYNKSETLITNVSLIIMGIQLVLLILVIVVTEKALKKNFNK